MFVSFSRLPIHRIGLAVLALLSIQSIAAAQGTTAITYQGNLTSSGFAANGAYDFRFILYDQAIGGSAVSKAIDSNDVQVANGVFTSEVDFGAAPFEAGAGRWLEVSVRDGASTGGYTVLAPRQHITPVPYALSALNLSGVLPVANGGTGSSVLNFMDLTSSEAISGAKTFSNAGGLTVNGRLNSSTSLLDFFAAGGVRLQRLQNPPANSLTGWVSPNIVGGFAGNSVAADIVGATIAGGGRDSAVNSVSGLFGTVGGGAANSASGENAAVGGGLNNAASQYAAVVGGGVLNAASGYASTVGGGHENTSSAQYSTIGGGYSHTAGGFAGTTAGGWDNAASGSYSTVGGGQSNQATGSWSVVPGGYGNVASAITSFAAGQSAQALHSGTFVWNDGSGGATASSTWDQVTMRAANGYRLYTNAGRTTGVQLAAGGGSWLNISDRNLKHEFRPLDPRAVLRKLAALDIAEWSYKSQSSSIRHIGPVAQDFHAAFGLGEDERFIGSVDADGVAMAAIQGLVRELEDTRARQEAAIAALIKRNEELEKRLERLERRGQ